MVESAVASPRKLLLAALALALVSAGAAYAGLLPTVTVALVGAGFLVVSAHLALASPEAWLATYVAALLLAPDPHFRVGGVLMGVNASDALFLGALPALVLRPLPRRSRLSHVALVVVAWAGFSLVSALLFSGPTVAAGSALRWIRLLEAFFPVFFVTLRISEPERALATCGRVFIGAATAAAAFGIAQFFLGFDLGLLGITYTAAGEVIGSEVPTRRAVGLFYEAGGFGQMSTLLCWASLFLLAHSRRATATLPLTMCLAVGALGVLLSFVRAALLALAGTLVVALAAQVLVRGRRLSWLRAVPALALTVGAVLLLAPGWARRYLEWRILPGLEAAGGTTWDLAVGITSGRLAMWSLLLDRYWHGELLYRIVGIGYKSLPFSPLTSAWEGDLLTGESQFVTTLLEQGAVGLVLFLLLNVTILKELWRTAGPGPTAQERWGRILILHWTALLLFVFPVLDYFAIFRLLAVHMLLVALVVTPPLDPDRDTNRGPPTRKPALSDPPGR